MIPRHEILAGVEEKLGDTDGVAPPHRVIAELAPWQAAVDAAATQPN